MPHSLLITPIALIPVADLLMQRPALLNSVITSQNPSSLNETNHNHHDRNNEKYMNQPSHGVRGYQSKQPEDYQYDGNGLKHFTPSLCFH